MRCRKNLRVLFAEYNTASPADKPNTALMKLKKAILALKNPALHPSQLISRPDVAADIANDIAMGMLGPGSTLVSRYDDFVWVHHQVMMQGPNDPSGPNLAHRGPAFAPWHRQLLKLFEGELRAAVGDPDLCLPYWDWTKDQSSSDLGFPFTPDFLGGDGAGNPNDKVTVGDFSQASGWTLNVDEEGFGYLRRHFGGDGPGLPTSQSVRDALGLTIYDVSPWNRNATGTGTDISFRNTLEGWIGPRQIHNAVHRWVDGSMQPGTSPNDPVFFLHHCNIDRLWAVWEQKHPALAPYLPDNSTAAASGLTRLDDRMATFGRTATDRYFGVDVTPADVVKSKAITWYDSDLPELTNETGSTLAFTNIPEGLTSYKAVKFKIKGCRPVRFRITGTPTGNFGVTPMGLEFLANPDDAAAFFYGYVWVQLTAVAGPIANSSVDIHAYIVDDEGYYAAAPGGEYALGDFHVELTATTVPRENNAVALVLDRSGSMADPAGGFTTKSGLLKNAVGVFDDLMLPNDELAIVSFDDQIATPITMQQVSGAPVAGVLAGTDLDPRGATWIGGGIQQGAGQLALATHTNKSMLVLTDGNENVHPYVSELPADTITNRTYAIGFGLPGDVSDPVLHQITSNTHGDLIITGNISTDEQRFNLTKYFVQVLAGVTNMNVILDPQGSLFVGSKHVIPFSVVGGDVYADVIAICPLPQLLAFALETPDGTVIRPSMAGAEPNVQYLSGQQVLCYRLAMPALAADAAGSHAGQWNAVLALKERGEIAKLLRNKEIAAAARAAGVRGSLPYSLVAHVYSNLRFEASMQQTSLKPGADVKLIAALSEYDVPFEGEVDVWAEIADPDLRSFDLQLGESTPGVWTGAFPTTAAGVYVAKVRAEGYSGSGHRFTREKTLTAGVYHGDYGTTPSDGRARVCELLECLLSDGALIDQLARLGVDLERLKDCLRKACDEGRREHVHDRPRGRKRAGGGTRTTFRTTGAAKPVKTAEPEPMVEALEPERQAAEQWPKVVRMFSHPEQERKAAPPDRMAADMQGGEQWPRVVRMFSPPEGEEDEVK